jgi:hypothetical protein
MRRVIAAAPIAMASCGSGHFPSSVAARPWGSLEA